MQDMTDTATIRSKLSDVEQGQPLRLKLNDGGRVEGTLRDVDDEGYVTLTGDDGEHHVPIGDVDQVLVPVRSQDPE